MDAPGRRIPISRRRLNGTHYDISLYAETIYYGFPERFGGDIVTLSLFELAIYFVIWGIFYLWLVKVIAERSAQAWIDRFDGDINPKGGDLLVHLLRPVIEQIENDQVQTLADFKKSFFASVAPQVREAKQMVREMNPVGAAIDAITKDNPLLGLIMSHVKLPTIELPSENSPQTSKDNEFKPGSIG